MAEAFDGGGGAVEVGAAAVDEGEQVVTAEAPTSEMAKYATDLKSMTQGRGSYVIGFARYDPAPQIIMDKVIAGQFDYDAKTGRTAREDAIADCLDAIRDAQAA